MNLEIERAIEAYGYARSCGNEYNNSREIARTYAELVDAISCTIQKLKKK